MGKRKVVQLSGEQRVKLENGQRTGKSHSFRHRCQMILLKSEQRTCRQVAQILGSCAVVVDNWVKRYEIGGIKGLIDSFRQRTQGDFANGGFSSRD